MCKNCEYNSDECCIFQDGLTGDFYYYHRTSQWDSYDDDWVYDRIYLNFCPWCGRELT